MKDRATTPAQQDRPKRDLGLDERKLLIEVLLAEYHELGNEKRGFQQTAAALLAVVIGASAALTSAIRGNEDLWAALPAAQVILMFAYGVLMMWAARITLRLAVLEENIDSYAHGSNLITWERSWSGSLRPTRGGNRRPFIRHAMPIIVTTGLYLVVILAWGVGFAVSLRRLSWSFWWEIGYGGACLITLTAAIYAAIVVPIQFANRYEEERGQIIG